MADYDLIVVGGGPAGYVGAIRAAQLGKKVACIEMDRAGGTCLNWGCIPTKSLLKNAEVYQLLSRHAADFGIKVEGLSYEWDKVIGRSRKVADRLAGGIEMLFKKNRIDYIRGEAAIPKAGVVEVTDKDGKKEEYKGAKILVSTGVVTREMPGFPFNGKSVISSKQAMVLADQPKDIIIVGAGAIGVEFAYFFNSFGTKVTLVEMLPNILPIEDSDVSAALEKSLAKQGIRILAGTKVEKAEATNKGVRLTVSGKASETIEASIALVAIGVSPLMPQGIKLETDAKGWLKTDANYETSVKGIYGAGDIIGPPWLAHVASFEAVQAVEGMFAGKKPRRAGVFPGCTYCQPQVASVGLTERAAKEKGLAFKIGKFPFMASGKAQAVGESEGFVKLIIGEKHSEILGAHIIGADATEMIAELGLAITMEATCEELISTIHAHPTLSEAVHEAAHASQGHAIHF
ncbi:MAG: dihydrolipoyl dehydrogenase [Verrucomicrobiota bacterium]